jgi:hypothetical protein
MTSLAQELKREKRLARLRARLQKLESELKYVNRRLDVIAEDGGKTFPPSVWDKNYKSMQRVHSLYEDTRRQLFGPRYTPEQETALKRLAQILAGVIRRQVDAKLVERRSK